MKSALDSMQGVSDTVRCIAESILTERVPERKTSKSNVRTSLKRSFKGSYGHTFSLDLFDSSLNKKLRSIGHTAFIELISYFINESLYRESKPLSIKARKVLDKLRERADDVIEELQKSALNNIHEISVKFDHDIKIRYRKTRDNITTIAKFDRESAEVLKAELSPNAVDLKVIITRLNIHTGNGRLQIEGEDETVAFGFHGSYKLVKMKSKKILSENLDYNNGIESEHWRYLMLTASPLVLKSGKVVKYMVKGVHEN